MTRLFASMLTLAALVLCLLSGFTTVEAQDMAGTFYIQFQTGYAHANSPDVKLPDLISSKLGNSFFFGGGAGYQFRRNLRADFTVTYRGGFVQNVEFGDSIRAKADFQSTAGMINVTYEFSDNSWHDIYPYVGGGFGYVYNQLSRVSIIGADGQPLGSIRSGGWANFGGQFGGGIVIPFHNDWRLDVGYRYFDGGKYESSDYITTASGVNLTFKKEEGSLSTNEITANLRIHLF